MPQVWKPTPNGKLFTTTPDWVLTLDGARYAFSAGYGSEGGSVLDLVGLSIEPGAIWATVLMPAAKGRALLKLDGIPNIDAFSLLTAVQAAIREVKLRQKLLADQFLATFDPFLRAVSKWSADLRKATKSEFKARGWLGREFIERLKANKPDGDGKLLELPEVRDRVAKESDQAQAALQLWRKDVYDTAEELNRGHAEKELRESRDFFDKVEKSPLTDEQANAVVCFDNRVLLVAAAGSGKTSTMVAKAGYALMKGYFPPEQILLLAFNSDAVEELRRRMKDRLEPLGLPAETVQAQTFHAFGLDVIGVATGTKPSLAPWVESGKDLLALQEMVKDLRDTDLAFRTEWDLFRLVLGQDLPKFGKEHHAPEAWDRDTRQDGFRTLNNEVVKSRGEQLIANWLFYNGVEYVYEGTYEVDTADPKHRQYRPDFYLPAAKAYLEHWALDESGEPPAEFTGYKEGMAWKRSVHAANGTTLLETTMAELWSGKAFSHLAQSLVALGLTLDPSPERPVPGRKPIENPRLTRTFRTFLTHVKSNRLAVEDLQKQIASGAAGQFRFRHAMFLRLFEKLWAAWEGRLHADKCIDFDDMLNLAANCIEAGEWKSPYRLVMVDEFQDASQARARLLAGLLKDGGRYLFAVGDDWQSINRFAGADLAVMTDFEGLFGSGTTLRLETTFRCSQPLCDISSQFVQRNPKQLKKTVRSTRSDTMPPVRIVRVDDEQGIAAAVMATLEEIASGNCGTRKARVFILGRYNKDNVYVPSRYDTGKLEVEFLTVHSSKGMEADHVVLPRMTSEMLGFPSQVADDPVLQLAMPGGDSYEYAEERRLFYVAMTRARSAVTLITLEGRDSPFVTELVAEMGLQVHDADGSASKSEVCPQCSKGFLASKKGRWGEFHGCSTFPRCRFTRNVASTPRRTDYARSVRSR